MEKSLLTKIELMGYLRISRSTLDKWIKEKYLPYIKLDRRVLFRREDIDRFIKSRTVNAVRGR